MKFTPMEAGLIQIALTMLARDIRTNGNSLQVQTDVDVVEALMFKVLKGDSK